MGGGVEIEIQGALTLPSLKKKRGGGGPWIIIVMAIGSSSFLTPFLFDFGSFGSSSLDNANIITHRPPPFSQIDNHCSYQPVRGQENDSRTVGSKSIQ